MDPSGTEGERLARVEQWKHDHMAASTERFETIIERLDTNDANHADILDRLDDMERSLIIYRRVVYITGSLIGMAAGLIIRFSDWIANNLGHYQ